MKQIKVYVLVIVSLFSVSISAQLQAFQDEVSQLYGFRNVIDNEIIVPPTYDYADAFSEGFSAVKLVDKWGFVGVNGKVSIPIQYKLVTKFSEGLAAAIKEEFWGFIDPSGKEAIPFIFGVDEFVRPVFVNGVVNLKFRDMYGYVNKQGDKLTEFKYDNALPFDQGVAAVQFEGRWGFIDMSGREVIAPIYDIPGDAFPVFRDGLTPLGQNGKYGYLNKSGNIVIPLQYDYASNFENGKATVRIDMVNYVLNTKGEKIK